MENREQGGQLAQLPEEGERLGGGSRRVFSYVWRGGDLLFFLSIPRRVANRRPQLDGSGLRP